MTEVETINFIQKGFEFATKVAQQAGINDNENYEQARKWLEGQLGDACAREVSKMKKQ